MKFFSRSCAVAILFRCLMPPHLLAQPVVTLEVEVEGTGYVADTTDFTKIARNREITRIDGPGPVPPNFFTGVLIYDVVRVNGNPAHGTHTMNTVQIRMSPNPAAGVAIADTTRATLAFGQIEFQYPDGRDIGSLSLQGYFNGAAPPGAPSGLGSSFSVVGGTGAFFGARGQVSQTSLVPGPVGRLPASIREDPSLRRVLGNQGSYKYVIQLVPLSMPQVESVYHANFSPVTAASPAQAGETLIVRLKSLVPIVGATLGEPAPATPAEIVPPVEVTVNGQPVVVVNKIAWPGTSDSYRVDFRLPTGATGGVDVKLSVGWIPGTAVRIPIR